MGFVTVNITLHGFPDLGGENPVVLVGMDATALTTRAVCKALLQRFGSVLQPSIGATVAPCGVSRGLHVFANNQPVTNLDEKLQPYVQPEGYVNLELIRLKPIAGG